MKKGFVCLCALLCMLLAVSVLAEDGTGDALHVTLPDGYADSGLRYPAE